MSDSEDDLPTLDAFFASKKLKKVPSEVEVQTQTISITPIKSSNHLLSSSPSSAERHTILAASLFPTPTPPTLSSISNFNSTLSNIPIVINSRSSRSISPTPSIISDSEPDLPSFPKLSRHNLTQEVLGFGEKNGTSKSRSTSIARHSSVESLLVNDSDEEEVDFGLNELTIDERKTPKASTSNSTRTPRTKSTLPKRRITISVTSSNSDSDSQPLSSLPLRSNSPRKAKAAASFGISNAAAIECICLDDSSDEEEQVLSKKKNKNITSNNVVESTPTSRRFNVIDDLDEDTGVLTYEPTPRARRPVKLNGSTPSKIAIKPKTPLLSRNIVEIDLTSSGDSSDEAINEFTPSISKAKKFSTPLSTPSRSKPLIKSKIVSNSLTPKPKTLILTAAERETLPLALIRELDKSVFRKEWQGLSIVGEGGIGLPDAIEIRWNKRLLNTAGRATVKTVTTNGHQVHQTLIDLSVKVIDTEEKLRHTLAHECCHVSSWIISKEMKPSHGPAFKLWAARVMQIRKDIKISTTHSYEIAYKYRWQSSINVDTDGWGCGSKLAQIDKDGNVKTLRVPIQKTAWQEFLTAMGPVIRIQNPGLNQGEITKIVAVQWQEAKKLAADTELMKRKDEGEELIVGMRALIVEE